MTRNAASLTSRGGKWQKPTSQSLPEASLAVLGFEVARLFDRVNDNVPSGGNSTPRYPGSSTFWPGHDEFDGRKVAPDFPAYVVCAAGSDIPTIDNHRTLSTFCVALMDMVGCLMRVPT